MNFKNLKFSRWITNKTTLGKFRIPSVEVISLVWWNLERIIEAILLGLWRFSNPKRNRWARFRNGMLTVSFKILSAPQKSILDTSVMIMLVFDHHEILWYHFYFDIIDETETVFTDLKYLLICFERKSCWVWVTVLYGSISKWTRSNSISFEWKKVQVHLEIGL